MSKKKRDVYYRKAKELGFRARSAFKLLDVDRRFDIFTGVDRAVDLCAAPGSWSQVLSRRLNRDNKASKCPVIAVDLQEMAPIQGVHILQGDITSVVTANKITSYFDGKKAQLVVCDGAPDVTGLHDIDEYVQAQLLLAALNITTHLLAPGGVFVAKVFKGPCHQLLQMQLETFFEVVHCVKPESSREASAEHFVMCKGFSIPSGYKPFLFSAIPKDNIDYESTTTKQEAERQKPKRGNASTSTTQRVIVPFLACGDLSGIDIDSKTPDPQKDIKDLGEQKHKGSSNYMYKLDVRSGSTVGDSPGSTTRPIPPYLEYLRHLSGLSAALTDN
ncbi:hypothetical protein AAMO2058_001576300 [Amorphochlora amoebiformis]